MVCYDGFGLPKFYLCTKSFTLTKVLCRMYVTFRCISKDDAATSLIGLCGQGRVGLGVMVIVAAAIVVVCCILRMTIPTLMTAVATPTTTHDGALIVPTTAIIRSGGL